MIAATIQAVRNAGLDYCELTKPRLTSFTLIVVALAAWLASPGRIDVALLFCAVLGAGLVGAGASALNMLLEREQDARMRRTDTRPLPSGRLRGVQVLLFGGIVTVSGLLILLVATTPLAAALAAITSVSYLAIYTPLKRVTTLNTHIGAVPGALPALIGWAAVRGSLDPTAWALFWIVYLWQVPHFLSIAWIYREDYARGGFRMLPCVDPDGTVTGRQAILGALALVPVSLLPTLFGVSGTGYFLGALALGAFFVHRAIGFARERTQLSARRLMKASLLYLPFLLALLVIDRLP